MIRSDNEGTLIDILVSPRASRAKLGPVHDDRLKVAVTAPPVDGAANAAVIELLARELGRPRRDLEVVGGASSRRKTVRVRGMTGEAVRKAIAHALPDSGDQA